MKSTLQDGDGYLRKTPYRMPSFVDLMLPGGTAIAACEPKDLLEDEKKNKCRRLKIVIGLQKRRGCKEMTRQIGMRQQGCGSHGKQYDYSDIFCAACSLFGIHK